MLESGLVAERSPESLCCVLEQDTLLVKPRKTHPHMTEKLLTGTLRIKSYIPPI